jgi:hypothetical protein
VACGSTEQCDALGVCIAVAVDAGSNLRRVSYVTRFGWDGDGGTTSALQPGFLAGAWIRAAQGLSFIPGTADDAGLMVIDGVPSGPLLFQLDPRTFLVTDEREASLENTVGGRLGASRAATMTPVTFDVTGLVPADAGHRVRVFFTQDREVMSLETRAMPPLGQGVTTFSAMVDWSRENNGRLTLPEASAGDEGWFAQLLEEALDGGASERRLVAAGRFPAVTLMAGTAATLSTALTRATEDVVPIDVDVPGHRALVAQFGNRPATGTNFVLGVTVTPAANPAAIGPLTTHVLRVPDTRAFPPSFALGAPFPASWATVADFRYQATFLRRSVNFLAGIRVVEPLSRVRARRLAPVLGPPREVNVAGRRVEFDVSALGPAPTVTWTAPSVGTAIWYRLRWYPLVAASDPPIVYWTKATRAELPEGILSASETYVLEVAAVSTGDGRPGTALPFAEAAFISGLLSL